METLRFKQGDIYLNTTMWVEAENDKIKISLETYRRYQEQWCSTIRLTVDEAKVLQEQLSVFLGKINT